MFASLLLLAAVCSSLMYLACFMPCDKARLSYNFKIVSIDSQAKYIPTSMDDKKQTFDSL